MFKELLTGTSVSEALFIQYLDTALWSSVHFADMDDSGTPMDDLAGIHDFSPEALEELRDRCVSFLHCVHAERLDYHDDYPEDETLGHDFWLTQNGHGVGFWDGDLPYELGLRLTEHAQNEGSIDLYLTFDEDNEPTVHCQ